MLYATAFGVLVTFFLWDSEDRYHTTQPRNPKHKLVSTVGNAVKLSCLLNCLSFSLHSTHFVHFLLYLVQEDQTPA